MVSYKLKCNDCNHVWEVELNGRKSPYSVPCPNYLDSGEACNSKSTTRIPNADEEIKVEHLLSIKGVG